MTSMVLYTIVYLCNRIPVPLMERSHVKQKARRINEPAISIIHGWLIGLVDFVQRQMTSMSSKIESFPLWSFADDY